MARLPLVFCLFALHAAAQPTAPAAGSYFPLDAGNEWVYRIDNRVTTALYQTWRIDRTEEIAGVVWTVMRIVGPGDSLAEVRFRVDREGRVYQLKGDVDSLFFDPIAPTEAAELKYMGRGGYTTALGTFPDVYLYRNESLGRMAYETGVLARGVGVVSSTESLMAGSSGGFSQGRTLVEATLAGGVRIGGKGAALELGLESLTVDVTGKKATNCAVPCYFVACALAPGADPPGTYKPCVQARVRGSGWGAGAPVVRVQLLAPDGTPAWQTTLGPQAVNNGVTYVQVPLYTAPVGLRDPVQPFAPGIYRLQAGAGDTAQSGLAFEVR